jgi:hypothetical protein
MYVFSKKVYPKKYNSSNRLTMSISLKVYLTVRPSQVKDE